MSRIDEDPRRQPRDQAAELTALQWRVASIAACGTILAGVVVLAAGPIDEVLASFDQHLLATDSGTRVPRYAPALRNAYATLVSDVEDAMVAFEQGALATTIDGAVIELPHRGVAHERASEPPRAPEDEAEAVAPHALGDGTIRIPAIGLDQGLVEGVTRQDLRVGPGHYPGTALPGQQGNVVISGHRTTYTRPFHDLDLLQPGDLVLIDTISGSHRYTVTELLVTSDDDARPLRDTLDHRLTLTTCHPKGSARERLVVIAHLDVSRATG